MLMPFGYFCTGILTTTLAQFLVYEGAGNQASGLVVLFTFVGVVLASLAVKLGKACSCSTKGPKEKSPESKLITPSHVSLLGVSVPRGLVFLVVTTLEGLGYVLSMIGMEMAGSGLFQVAHASTIVWSALLTIKFTDRRLSTRHWSGVLTIVGGLVIAALGPLLSQSSQAPAHGEGPSAVTVVLGVILSVVGAASFSCSSACTEALLEADPTADAMELAGQVGVTGSALCSIWVLFVTLPRWEELVERPMAAAGGNAEAAMLTMGLYTVAHAGHTVLFFNLLGSVGAVVVGVVQGMRAVGVFASAALLFCARQESQCFTVPKALATLVVVTGVVLYVTAPSTAAPATGQRKPSPKVVAPDMLPRPETGGTGSGTLFPDSSTPSGLTAV